VGLVNPLWCVPFTRFRSKNSAISLAIQSTLLSADQITGGSLFQRSPLGSTAIKPTSVGILPPRFNRVTLRSGGGQHTTSWDRRASWKN
jgi:hypothetical protein